MKFSDFFLPKIARSDPEKRKEAVREEVNVELLKMVVQKDGDVGVRQEAQKRIEEIESHRAA